MMRHHHTMLKCVLDSIEGTESILPLGDHSSLQKSWYNDQYFMLERLLEESELKQKQKDRAKHVFHLVTDAYNLFLKEAENPTWQSRSVEERHEIVKALQQLPQIEQRSDAWYQHFAKCLTASEFASLFSSPKKRKDLVLSKVNPRLEERGSFRLACPTDELSPFGWGIRFEPVVKQILENKDHCTIVELGRITHPTTPTLAASPDGIVSASPHKHQVGRLIEIKCPYSRQVGFEIPFEYWVQMQIQMEVTNIDECEYIEVELESAKPNKVCDLSGTTLQGQVYLVKQIVEEDQPFEYKYVYGEIGSTVPPTIPEGYEISETIPWGLKKWHRKIVHRDRSWYESTIPWQQAFWADVERVKSGQDLAIPVVETNSSKQTQCLIQDSE